MRMSLLHCISQLEPQSLGPPLPVTYRHSAGLVSQMCSDKCLLIALVLSWVIQAQLLRLRPPSWPGLSLSGPTINVRNHPQQQIHLAESRLLIPVALGSCPGGQCLGWTPPPPPGHSCANKSPGVLVKWRFLICHSRRCWNFVFLNITVCVCVRVCVLNSQSYDFSSGHVWMGKLNHREGWVQKNWCCQTVVLEKTLESLLNSKETKPVIQNHTQNF